MPYETVGDLFLEFPTPAVVENYRRDLNLDTAVASVSYTSGREIHTRNFFQPGGPGHRCAADGGPAGADFLHRRNGHAAEGKRLKPEDTLVMRGVQWQRRHPGRAEISGPRACAGAGREKHPAERIKFPSMPDSVRRCSSPPPPATKITMTSAAIPKPSSKTDRRRRTF
jgi:hypothetical protein